MNAVCIYNNIRNDESTSVQSSKIEVQSQMLNAIRFDLCSIIYCECVVRGLIAYLHLRAR